MQTIARFAFDQKHANHVYQVLSKDFKKLRPLGCTLRYLGRHQMDRGPEKFIVKDASILSFKFCQNIEKVPTCQLNTVTNE